VIQDERFFYCTGCHSVSYRQHCCDEPICTGGGCDQCNKELAAEAYRRIDAGEHPVTAEMIADAEAKSKAFWAAIQGEPGELAAYIKSLVSERGVT
jgi:hypothetical protein